MGILQQVKEVYFNMALFINTHEIIIDKRKYNCALDTHLYGHLYFNVNVIDHPEYLILH